VSDLISSSPSGFDVTFQWTKGIRVPGKGVFVWREAGSSYRWDGIVRDAAGAERGTFSLVRWGAGGDRTDFADDTVASCEWFGQSGESDVYVGCEAGESPATGDPSGIVNLSAQVTGTLPDRAIAGHHARCFSYAPIVGDTASFCIDSWTSAPLYFTSLDALGAPQELMAIAVSDQTPTVALPSDPSLVPGARSDVILPLTELLLPSIPPGALQ
jgi:hypothetical protein